MSAALSQVSLADDEPVWALPKVVLTEPHRLAEGLIFAAAWMAILSAHELGHMAAARFWGTPHRWPIFVPAPSLFGTLGAVMPMTGLAPHRRALLHISILGPIMGAIVALPLFVWGLCPSYGGQFGVGQEYYFGASPIIDALVRARPCQGVGQHPNPLLRLTPLGQAGWLGLFWTGLNLVPIGQLDGGHILYCATGCGLRHRLISCLMALALFAVGLVGGNVWAQSALMWCCVTLVAAAMGTTHDGVQDGGRKPLGNADWAIVVAALLVLVATFVVVPLWPQASLSFGEDGFRG